jgi:altronate dehydratase small subunit
MPAKGEFVASASRSLSVDALVLRPGDNVATALRALAAGETVRVGGGGHDLQIELRQDIPLCHKFALVPVADGAVVIKYGESIGKTSRNIATGEHVHVHNLVSARARQV